MPTSGQDDRFQQIYEESRERVWTLCLRMLGSEDLARDAFQECFIRAWQALPEFRGESKASTWLWKIAYRCALEQLRHEQRHRHHELDDELHGAGRQLPRETALEQRDMTEFLLANLNPTQRALIHLRYTMELSYDEIAQSTGTSLSSVKVGLHRAKAAMRKRWQESHDIAREQAQGATP